MTTEKNNEKMKLIVIALLVLNVLLGVYIAFFKHDALRLETLKAGGKENMNMAKQLYQSDIYVQQQKTTLDQIMNSMNQVDTTTAQPQAIQELPTVAQ
jgi:hypothetical protein